MKFATISLALAAGLMSTVPLGQSASQCYLPSHGLTVLLFFMGGPAPPGATAVDHIKGVRLM
jgi:hypothetical protein